MSDPADGLGLEGYLRLREAFAERRPSGGGRQIAVELVQALDTAIGQLAESLPANVVVVAAGGYGRGDLCLGSDVDLMTIHVDRPDPGEVAPLLYPLWDAKLVVGHAARTVREIVGAGRESIETLSALMTMRYLAGDRDRYDEAMQAVTKLVTQQSGGLAEILNSEEAARRTAEPYWLLAADTKAGRGGLRTLNGIALERMRTRREGGDLALVADVLLDVRNAIHAVTGYSVRKPSNVFAFEVREQVAGWLGADSFVVGERLQQARRSAERLASQEFPRLGESKDPVVGVGRWMVRSLRRKPSGSYSSAFVQAAAVFDGPEGKTFSAAEEQAVRAAGPPLWSNDDRGLFVRLLAGGANGRAVVERLHDFGWLAKALPEWAESQDRPHQVPFHAYTVGSHHWSTVDEIIGLIDDDDPMLTTVADELGSVDDLLLAGFFHDVGKSRPGDHSVVGAEMVTGFAERAHFGNVTRRRLGQAVRFHLLIPDTAFGRDIDDRAVITDVAERVGDVQLLRLLYLLSIADARSTGPNMLSAWKANLMRKLFGRVEEQMTGSPSPSDPESIVAAAGGAVGPQRVASFLEAMPPGYVDRFSAEEVVRHLQVTSPPPRSRELRWNVEQLGTVTSLVMAAVDEPGLLVRVAGTMAAYGIDVLDARLVTSSDGIGVDTFHVEDALQGGPVGEHKLEEVRRDLIASVGYRDRLDERRRRYGAPGAAGSVKARRDRQAAIIEVRAADRIGLLHDVSEVVTRYGASIHLAKIRSRHDLAIDTLWLRDSASGDDLSDRQLEGLVDQLSALFDESTNPETGK